MSVSLMKLNNKLKSIKEKYAIKADHPILMSGQCATNGICEVLIFVLEVIEERVLLNE